jgi:GNAT superfamily N-acetyltransferase
MDDNRYVFRLARRADLETIVALLADDPLGSGREDPAGGMEAYAAAFELIERDTMNEVIVAEFDGAVAGCLQLTLIPGLTRNAMTRAQIEGVRIASSERGRGLGRKMFEWVIAESRKRGAGLVQLTTDKSRPDAHRFYEGLGFVASHEGMKLSLR